MERETTATKKEVSFDDIRSRDVLLIETLNGLYKFSVIDSVKHYGILVGGIFKDRPVIGFLCRASELRHGERAKFLVRTKGYVEFITTSAITGLTHIMCE